MRLLGLLAILAAAACGGDDDPIGGPNTIAVELDDGEQGGFTEVYLEGCVLGSTGDLVICTYDGGDGHELTLWLLFSINWRTVPDGTILIQGTDFTVMDVVYSFDGVDGISGGGGAVLGALTIEVRPPGAVAGAEFDGTIEATDLERGDFTVTFEQVPAELP